MKNYTITVNGTAYQVTVEEGTTTAAAPVAAPASAAPVAAPAPAASAGSIEIKSSVPGRVIGIEVSPGQAVKKGDNVLILESMKMEIPVVAPQDGTIAGIQVSDGASVENGDVLATMNE